MQTQAYEGYFDDGRFYVSGKAMQVPERRRVVITVFGDSRQTVSEIAKKREILRNLRGSCKGMVVAEPAEVPPEYDAPRRFDLI